MPSDKRARQRASRDAKRQEQAKQARRRTLIRNGVIVAVIAAVIVGAVVYFSSRGSSPSASSTTTTTSTTTAANKATATLQAKANRLAVASGCPSSTSTRTNTLSWPSPPAMTIDPTKTYKAEVKTTAGTFVITLLAKTAPTTVNNFVFLAKQDYFKCNTFHRVIPGFMDQTGDPTGTGAGGPGYEFANENVPKAYATGDVAMANSGSTKPTNGSQFFIVAPGGATTLDHDLANGGYSLFGKVVTGLSVVDKINSQGNSTSSANGTPPKVIQRILKVTITTS